MTLWDLIDKYHEFFAAFSLLVVMFLPLVVMALLTEYFQMKVDVARAQNYVPVPAEPTKEDA